MSDPGWRFPENRKPGELAYLCFFCGQPIMESDPDRLDLVIADPQEDDIKNAMWYSCDAGCASEAGSASGMFWNPRGTGGDSPTD